MDGQPLILDRMVLVAAAASRVWGVLASLTLTHWLLVVVIVGFWRLEGIEQRRLEREMILDAASAGAASAEDMDRLRELDREKHP
jgi:hypothetical protein